MENLTKELPFELAHFQVEELESRLENCWKGMENQDHGTYDQYGEWHSNWVKVPCGTPHPNESNPDYPFEP